MRQDLNCSFLFEVSDLIKQSEFIILNTNCENQSDFTLNGFGTIKSVKIKALIAIIYAELSNEITCTRLNAV